MEENSPLRFLNYDVSRMIYEIYYPKEKEKQWKNLTIHQFKYHLQNYLTDNRFSNIYEKMNNITIIQRDPWHHRNRMYTIYKPYPFIDYLIYHHKRNIKKMSCRRTIINKQYCLFSWRRAKEYKREANKLKRDGRLVRPARGAGAGRAEPPLIEAQPALMLRRAQAEARVLERLHPTWDGDRVALEYHRRAMRGSLAVVDAAHRVA